MSLSDIAGPISAALESVRLRAAVTISAEVPADVTVSLSDRGIALAGRGLLLRSLTDPRLRDFAGLIR